MLDNGKAYVYNKSVFRCRRHMLNRINKRQVAFCSPIRNLFGFEVEFSIVLFVFAHISIFFGAKFASFFMDVRLLF